MPLASFQLSPALTCSASWPPALCPTWVQDEGRAESHHLKLGVTSNCCQGRHVANKTAHVVGLRPEGQDQGIGRTRMLYRYRRFRLLLSAPLLPLSTFCTGHFVCSAVNQSVMTDQPTRGACWPCSVPSFKLLQSKSSMGCPTVKAQSNSVPVAASGSCTVEAGQSTHQDDAPRKVNPGGLQKRPQGKWDTAWGVGHDGDIAPACSKGWGSRAGARVGEAQE